MDKNFRTYIVLHVSGALFCRVFRICSDSRGFYYDRETWEEMKGTEYFKQYLSTNEALAMIREAQKNPELYNHGAEADYDLVHYGRFVEYWA